MIGIIREYKRQTKQSNKGNKTMTTTVMGRNGYEYDAVQVKGNLFIVGKFIVTVEDGKCKQTICKATKANVARFSQITH